MRLAPITAAIVLAAALTNAFAQDTAASTASSDTQTQATPRKWYQAGERELQNEAQKAALDRAGFPQYEY